MALETIGEIEKQIRDAESLVDTAENVNVNYLHFLNVTKSFFF